MNIILTFRETAVSKEDMETPILKTIRARGSSVAWLAKQVGVSRPTAANWANGSRIPSRHEAEAICAAMPELTIVEVLWPEGLPGDVRLT